MTLSLPPNIPQCLAPSIPHNLLQDGLVVTCLVLPRSDFDIATM
jgi:hypothetical protein